MGVSVWQQRRIAFKAILFVAVLAGLMLLNHHVFAGDARVVTVFADGEEKTISSSVTTVKEALAKAGVEVGSYDLVEPSVDTEIIDAVFRINVYRARPVTVVDGSSVRNVMTPYRSERLIAKDAGFDVYEEDSFTMERMEDFLTGQIGQKLTIIRSTPVTIKLYGNTLSHRTRSETVGQVLAENNITPVGSDKVEPSLGSPVKRGMVISIVHVGKAVEAREEPIAFSTETVYDSNHLQGWQEVKQTGVNGVRLVTYEVTKENNNVVDRREIQSVVATEPVNQIVIVGTKIADPSSNQAIGQLLAGQRGWQGDEWGCLNELWMRESKWNHQAQNPHSGAYGIPQALPGSKMAVHGDDWASNPQTQIKWGLDYIAGRYGTPCGAWGFFTLNNWY